MSRLLIILGFIFIGLESRLIPHPPNFTSINAIAFFSAFYLGNWQLSLVTVLSTVFISDIFIGFYTTMPFVYLCYGFIILTGCYFKEMSLYRIPLISLCNSFLFFMVSNFGVWVGDSLYPKTVTGLSLCYIAGIPFLLNQILGDIAYGILLFGYVHVCKNYFQKENLGFPV